MTGRSGDLKAERGTKRTDEVFGATVEGSRNGEDFGLPGVPGIGDAAQNSRPFTTNTPRHCVRARIHANTEDIDGRFRFRLAESDGAESDETA